MIEVISEEDVSYPSRMYLSDITEGTLFRGRLHDVTGKTYSGVWLAYNEAYLDAAPHLVAILLGRKISNFNAELFAVDDYANGSVYIENYEELDGMLTVTPKR